MGCVYRVQLETTAQSCTVTRSTSKLAKRSDRYRQSRRLHSEPNWNAVSFLQRAVHPLEINNGWWRRRTSVNFSKFTRGVLPPFNYRWIFQSTRETCRFASKSFNFLPFLHVCRSIIDELLQKFTHGTLLSCSRLLFGCVYEIQNISPHNSANGFV